MNNPRLASRYAKSIIDLSIENGQLDTVYADMKLIQRICASNPDFVAVLRSPIISAGTKGKIVTSILKEQVGKITAGFIKLLVNKTRESNLPEIAGAFVDQYNEIKNIHKVKIITAVPMSEDMQQAILAKVGESAPGQTLELETFVNDELVGGFIIEKDGKYIDASVMRHLKDVKKHFLNNDYLQKLR